MREGFVETANGRIWYAVYGEQRQKAPILVVHGGPGFLSMSAGLEAYNSMWGPSEFTIRGKLKDFDLMPRLPEITQPVLLTCGDRDEAGVKTVKDFQLAFPDACMAVIPKAAHFHHLERPEIFTAVVQEFLRGMA